MLTLNRKLKTRGVSSSSSSLQDAVLGIGAGLLLDVQVLGERLPKVQSELTVDLLHKNPEGPNQILAYQLTETLLQTPRCWPGVDYCKAPCLATPGEALSSEASFCGELRPEQKAAIADLAVALRQAPYSTLGVMPCGFGKTVVGLAIIAQLGRRACVAVHKSFLLEQWADRIRVFLPGAQVAQISGTTKKEAVDQLLQTCDIAIVMVQTLTRHDLNLEAFGTLIVDECHHMAAQTFSRLFFRCRAKYVLGLSATPYRADGCTALLFWYLNGIGHRVDETDRAAETRVRIWCSTVPYSRPSIERREPQSLMQEVQWIRRILAQDPVRNGLLVQSVDLLVAKGHRVIVLSHRVEHLHQLRKSYCSRESHASSAFYIGGQSAADRAAAEKAQVVFGTYQMASEGLDMPWLSALVFATPTGEIRQAVGRIMRPCANKLAPVEVHDFADDSHGLLVRWSLKRQKFFQQLGADTSRLDLSTA